jgi:plastocyanin
MSMSRALVAIALVLALVAALGTTACSSSPSATPSGGSPASTPAAGAPKAVTVSMKDIAFDPASVEVPVGGTVTWTNNDTVAHTVRIDGTDSGNIEPGATYSKTFGTAGTFPFSCGIHPSMTGVLTVK